MAASALTIALSEASRSTPASVSCASTLMRSALKAALQDDCFRIPSPTAKEALSTASSLSVWCDQPEHQLELGTFASRLAFKLKACLGSSIRSQRLRKDKMWGTYHAIRTSPELVSDWTSFMKKSIGHTSSPVFYQFITHTIFKALIKQEFDVPESATDRPLDPLTSDDENALRYVAGYVCRKLRTRLESSSHPEKNDMILTLMEFRGNSFESNSASEEWTNAIDRGGLWHVTDDVFLFFCIMEEEIRRHLSSARPTWSDGLKKELTEGLTTNEDVLFQWCTLSAELDTHASTILQKMVIELYVTIRGFAFVSSCMELYKQSQKKTIQRAKGIRRSLFESND